MDYAVVGEDYSLKVVFKVDDTFITPDNSTYTYKLRKSDGTILDTQTIIIPEDEPQDQDKIVIPSEFNTKESNELFAERIVEVSFTNKDEPVVFSFPYRITDYLTYTASTRDIREYYGLNEGELPDNAVDMKEIYIELAIEMGEIFTNSIKSHTRANFRANRLMVLTGAVKIFSSLRLRTNQEEGDGSSKFIRYMKFDWDKLLSDAQKEIDDLKNNLTGEETTSQFSYTPFAFGEIDDIITGG